MAQRVPSNRNVKWLPLQSNDNAPPGPFAARPVKRISGESAGVNTGPLPRPEAAPQAKSSRAKISFFIGLFFFQRGTCFRSGRGP